MGVMFDIMPILNPLIKNTIAQGDRPLVSSYSIWDALDGEAEAAGNIDYEW